jgi:hypothetical protein
MDAATAKDACSRAPEERWLDSWHLKIKTSLFED